MAHHDARSIPFFVLNLCSTLTVPHPKGKTDWQAFCESCATEYAANEGYIKEEEIDQDMMEYS